MDESQIVSEVVESLRKAREEKGISRYRIAKETGLSPSGIRHMENGEVTPTLFFLLRFATYLEIDLGTVISDTSSKNHNRTKKKNAK